MAYRDLNYELLYKAQRAMQPKDEVEKEVHRLLLQAEGDIYPKEAEYFRQVRRIEDMEIAQGTTLDRLMKEAAEFEARWC